MKKIIFFTFLIYSTNLFAIDRFVDLNLSSGNGTTLFTTINSAVAASVNGDRILIVAGTYNEPTLTLSKSLTLLAQTPGSIINYNGNIVIAGFPGMKLEILGFNLGIYSLSSNTISGGSISNRAKVSLIESQMTDLSVNNDFYELNCARCTMSGTTTFRFGNFVASKTDNLNVYDEPTSTIYSERILVVCDTIDNIFFFSNDNAKLQFSNNLIRNIQILKWQRSTTDANVFSNNEFIPNSFILFAKNAPYYNIVFTNNYFPAGDQLFYRHNSGNPCAEGGAGNYGQGLCWSMQVNCTAAGCISEQFSNGGSSYSASIAAFPTPTSNGFFEWTYNGIDLPCTIPAGIDPLVLTKIIGTTGTIIDAGSPNHDFYDTDLTVNDRGRMGGPYSILNYNPTINSSNGKAFIFDLEMPTDLFPGQQFDIKSKGFHKN
jgi:hypothetical protein